MSGLLPDHDPRCPMSAQDRTGLHDECLCGDLSVLDRHHGRDGGVVVSTQNPAPRPIQQYACGYLIGPDRRVVLIRKNRPEWQAGRLNGVGGHVEPGETPVEAMRREFREETGLDVDGWEHFATILWSTGETYFYRRFAADDLIDAVRTVTDEVIEVHPMEDTPWNDGVAALSWLLPLALYPTPLAQAVVIREAV